MADMNFKKAQMQDKGSEAFELQIMNVVHAAKEMGISIDSVIAIFDKLSDFYQFERRMMWHEDKLKRAKERQEAKADVNTMKPKPGVSKKKK